MNYAAELDDDNVVTQVIVGTAQWATDNLGGTWVDTDHKAGPGWVYLDGELVPPEPDPEFDDEVDLSDQLA